MKNRLISTAFGCALLFSSLLQMSCGGSALEAADGEKLQNMVDAVLNGKTLNEEELQAFFIDASTLIEKYPEIEEQFSDYMASLRGELQNNERPSDDADGNNPGSDDDMDNSTDTDTEVGTDDRASIENGGPEGNEESEDPSSLPFNGQQLAAQFRNLRRVTSRQGPPQTSGLPFDAIQLAAGRTGLRQVSVHQGPSQTPQSSPTTDTTLGALANHPQANIMIGRWNDEHEEEATSSDETGTDEDEDGDWETDDDPVGGTPAWNPGLSLPIQDFDSPGTDISEDCSDEQEDENNGGEPAAGQESEPVVENRFGIPTGRVARLRGMFQQ